MAPNKFNMLTLGVLVALLAVISDGAHLPERGRMEHLPNIDPVGEPTMTAVSEAPTDLGNHQMKARSPTLSPGLAPSLLESECPANCTCTISRDMINISSCERDPSDELAALLTCYPNLRSLRINQARLLHIPHVVCDLKKLKSLNLEYNLLQAPPWACLGALPDLVNLTLNHNNITCLLNGSLSGFPSLQRLALSHNNLSQIDVHAVPTSNPLPALRLMDLSRNQLHSVDSWPLHFLTTDTSFINLSRNKIRHFTNHLGRKYQCEGGQVKSLISFKHNKIERISDILCGWGITDPTQVICIIDQMPFALYDNLIICDCVDFDLFKYIRYSQRKNADQILCHSPLSLYKQPLVAVPLDKFVCHLNQDCPPGCDCMQVPNQMNMSINCDEVGLTALPLRLPRLPKVHYGYWLSFRKNNISVFEYHPYMFNTTAAILSHNTANEITLGALKALGSSADLLDLHGNCLPRLPEGITVTGFPSVVEVYLHDNSWVCDCHILETRRWLLEEVGIIPDHDGILCVSPPELQGTSLLTLDPSSLKCGPHALGLADALMMASLVTVAFVAVFAVTTSLLYCKRLAIFRATRWHPFNRDECKGERKEFDVFVSYTESGEGGRYVIEDLIPGLQQRGYKVGHHRVSFISGMPIIENIRACILRSKRTLVVIAPEFEESDWCPQEMTLATELDQQLHTNRLVIVVLRDTNIDDLDPTVHTHLRKHGFLRQEDTNEFWMRLEYLLPVKKISAKVDHTQHRPEVPSRLSVTSHLPGTEEANSTDVTPLITDN